MFKNLCNFLPAFPPVFLLVYLQHIARPRVLTRLTALGISVTLSNYMPNELRFLQKRAPVYTTEQGNKWIW